LRVTGQLLDFIDTGKAFDAIAGHDHGVILQDFKVRIDGDNPVGFEDQVRLLHSRTLQDLISPENEYRAFPSGLGRFSRLKSVKPLNTPILALARRSYR
jgi:hypothetical protein